MTDFNSLDKGGKLETIRCMFDHARYDFSPPPKDLEPGAYCGLTCAFLRECRQIYGEFVDVLNGDPEEFREGIELVKEYLIRTDEDCTGMGVEEIVEGSKKYLEELEKAIEEIRKPKDSIPYSENEAVYL